VVFGRQQEKWPTSSVTTPKTDGPSASRIGGEQYEEERELLKHRGQNQKLSLLLGMQVAARKTSRLQSARHTVPLEGKRGS